MRIAHRRVRAVFVALAMGLIVPALGASLALAADETVVTRVVGSHGRILVAGSNGMTLYTFDTDVKDSGVSACTGSCVTEWPPLTVETGVTPTGDSLVTGTLGTIKRADNGALQVTYNGLPLYFFSGDKAPGDTNGIYPGWQAVTIVNAAGGGVPPTSTVEPVVPAAPVPLPVGGVALVAAAGLVTFVVFGLRVRRRR